MTAPWPPESPPRRICLIRLSALGDVTHILPVVHALRAHWPDARITWIVGRHEHRLVGLFPGVEFLTLDKRRGWRGYRELSRQLRGRAFDLLLLMQVSMRAHLASLSVRAPYRLGYDRVRGRDLHGLFVNHRIPHRDREHVLDGHLGFLRELRVPFDTLNWQLPIPDRARDWVREKLPPGQPYLLISPASSVALRNWHAAGYAAVADAAWQRYGLQSVICGGPSAQERALADAILMQVSSHTVVDLVGQDTLPQLLALIAGATALISPDSGPAHMASITDTPVIGLYGLSNPERCGPYKSRDDCVDAHPRACREILGRSVDALPWGTRVEDARAMALIEPDAVIGRLDSILRSA